MRSAADPARVEATATRPRHPRRARVVAVVSVLTLAGAAFVGVGAVQAAPPTTDPVTAAEYGARWIAAQVNDEGFVPGAGGAADVTVTLQDALALASAGVEEATFDRMVGWLTANVATIVPYEFAPGNDPGRIGELLLLADAAGIDPANFGGADLLALLQATLGTYEVTPGVPVPGLYGAASPDYDGAYRQGLAILGLAAVGAPVPTVASDWLADQQCDVPSSVAGGWQPFRIDTSDPCTTPEPSIFNSADTNSTAVALQALLALGSFPGAGDALDYLERSQEADGGFALLPGGSTDPNSTALVIQAIVAGGEDPAAGRWLVGSASPVTSLLGWQLGCVADPADQGAFSSPYAEDPTTDPNAFATSQAVWGAAFVAFPLDGPVTFHAGAVPCLPPSTTTTTTAPGSTTTTAPGSTTTTTARATTAAVVVVAEPQFAG